MKQGQLFGVVLDSNDVDYKIDILIGKDPITFTPESSGSKWWIYFSNKKLIIADPYNWGENSPWRQEFNIRIDFNIGEDNIPKIRISDAYYTLYEVLEEKWKRASRSKGYDYIKLPYKEKLEKLIAQKTGIQVIKYNGLVVW
jgi:hypothetical protein